MKRLYIAAGLLLLMLAGCLLNAWYTQQLTDEMIQDLQQAQQAARTLLEEDPELSAPEDRPVLERVRQLFAATPDIFN